MHQRFQRVCLLGLSGLMLMVAPGCGKSQIQAEAGGQTSTPGARAGQATPVPPPDLAMRGQGDPLKGLESVKPGQSLKEERIGGGTAIAKAEPSGATRRQVEEMQAGLNDIFFDFDRWTLSEDSKDALTRSAEWLKGNAAQKVAIEGHCDERGTQGYNLVLGEKRAKAARNYLIELGVAANRLTVVSYGKERPFCKGHEETCYQQNRRAHMVAPSK